MLKFFQNAYSKKIFSQARTITTSNSNSAKNIIATSAQKLSTDEALQKANENMQKAMQSKLYDIRYQNLKPVNYSSIKNTLDESVQRRKHSKY